MKWWFVVNTTKRKLSISTFCFHTPQWTKSSIAVNCFRTSWGFSFVSLVKVWFKVTAEASLIDLTNSLLMHLMWASRFSPAGEWRKICGKTKLRQMAASAAFFPLNSISASLHDSRTAVCRLLTGSYTAWSMKPSLRELVVELSLYFQHLTIARFFKAYAICQAWHKHE